MTDSIDIKGIYNHPPMRRTSKRRPNAPMKAHIRFGSRYIYKQLNWQPRLSWLNTGDEVSCCHTLPDDPTHCVVESLDADRFGKVHILALRLAGDFSRK